MTRKEFSERMTDILVYSLLLSIWFVTISLFRSLIKQSSKSRTTIQQPPSPPALPIIGHLHFLGSVLPRSFETLSSRYGPLMRLRIVSSSVVVVSDAATAKEMLKNNEMNFINRSDTGSSSYNIYQGSSFITAEYGTFWRFMKKLCMTELLSPPQVNRFADIRREETMKLMETLVQCSDRGDPCDLSMHFMSLANNLICKMVMSTRCSTSEDESKLVWDFVKNIQELFGKLVFGEILGPVGKLDLFGYGRKLKALLMKFDSLVERIMLEHEKARNSERKERKDMLDILLQISRDEKAEIKLTRKEIKSFLMELFIAGTETTSVAMQWTMAELIRHPNVVKKLREEINRVVGSKRLVQESDVPNLPYLQAVVKENLRLHPSAPLSFRRCEKDCKINGYDIFENERIILNLRGIMRDPSSWENPLDFIPERFMVEDPKRNFQMDPRGQNFNLVPFGSGRRGCPGASLALTIIHGVIAVLVQCFDFKVEDGKEINMEEAPGFASPMAHPLLCYPVVRFNPFQLVNGNQ